MLSTNISIRKSYLVAPVITGMPPVRTLAHTFQSSWGTRTDEGRSNSTELPWAQPIKASGMAPHVPKLSRRNPLWVALISFSGCLSLNAPIPSPIWQKLDVPHWDSFSDSLGSHLPAPPHCQAGCAWWGGKVSPWAIRLRIPCSAPLLLPGWRPGSTCWPWLLTGVRCGQGKILFTGSKHVSGKITSPTFHKRVHILKIFPVINVKPNILRDFIKNSGNEN